MGTMFRRQCLEFRVIGVRAIQAFEPPVDPLGDDHYRPSFALGEARAQGVMAADNAGQRALQPGCVDWSGQ